MKHLYWETPIALYLFLGGLGGGLAFLSWLMVFFVFPGSTIGSVMVCSVFISLICLALGCFFLVFELGQPPVFWRVFTTATAIIKWGATLLSICIFGDLFFVVAYLPWDFISPLANFFWPMQGFWLTLAGVAGFGIMVYTGVMLSTLKAHAFWATPALPVLFTISAFSTACAMASMILAGWPAQGTLEMIEYAESVHELIHVVDIVLVLCEITVLLIMVLSFLGAGNVTQKKVAKRWVKGSVAPFFWIGMIGIGLLCPFILYVAAPGIGSSYVAPILALCGGLLLRFLCVWSDDRAPLPGEERYYARLKTDNKAIVTYMQQVDELTY